MRSGILFSLLLSSLLFQSCYNDKRDQLYPTPVSGGCDTSGVTYSGYVSKVVGSTTCSKSGCHLSPSTTGVTLDNYQGVRIVALDRRLVGVISYAPGYVHMPQDAGQLDACTIAKIAAWVAQGAPNN